VLELILVVYHSLKETGCSTISANGKQNFANGRVRSRLTCTISPVHLNLQRESGTSLTIGTGPGTGRKRQNGIRFFVDVPVKNFGVHLKLFRLFSWKVSGRAN